MGDSSGFPDRTLENIAYLARSENRVRILEVLAEGPSARNEVEETTDIARTTIDRIINELEERGWAKRTVDGEYIATPTGEQVITEFEPFVETMEGIRKLGDLVAWLPTDTVPIALRHFGDATIRCPDPAEPTSTVSYVTELLREAAEFRCLVGIAPPLAFEETMRDGVVCGDLKTEHVITEQEYHYLLENPDRLERWQEYIEAGANLYLHEGPVPCNVLVFDDTVIIGNSQAELGDPFVEIESTNDIVRAWAHDVIREYKEDAKRLDAAAFR